MRTASILPFAFRDDQYRVHTRQERFRQFEKPRRFAWEAMEPRLMLSVDSAVVAPILLDTLGNAEGSSLESLRSAGSNGIGAALAGPAGQSWNVPSQSLYEDPAIPQSQEDLITQGLQGFSSWLDTLGEFDALSQQLPFVDRSVGDLLDLGNLVQEKLLTPVQNFFGTDTDQLTETEDLRQILEALTETIGPVTGGFNATNNTIEYNQSFSANRSLNVPIDLGAAAELLGINVDSATSPTVAVTGTFSFGFTFGIRLEPGLAPSEAFFIIPGTPLAATLAISVNNGAPFDLDLGFVDAAVGAWSANLNASIQATITDSDTSDPLTLAELAGTPISTLASITTGPATNALDVKLPVSVSLGSFSTSGDVRITDANLFNATAPSVNVFQTNTTTPHQDLLNFTNIQPGDILGVLDGLGNALQYARESLDTPIPLVGGTVGDLIQYGEVIDSLVDPLFDVVLTSSLHVVNPNLSGAAHFSVSIDGGAATAVTVTDFNRTTLTALVGDIAAALPAGLGARLVGDQVELFATSAAIRSFQLSAVLDTDPASTQLGLQNGQQSDLIFKFRTVGDLVSLLSATGLDYNATSDVVEFDLAFIEEFNRELPLDFAEGLGPLTVGGSFNATASVGAGFDLTLNFDLTPVSTTLTGTTLLSALGVNILPTITASADAPAQGKLLANSDFTITLNGTALALTLLKTSTDDNLLRSQIVDDLNTLFDNTATDSIQTGTNLGEFIAATLLGTKIRLVALDSAPVSVLSLTISAADELGFAAGIQLGDADLMIRLRNDSSFTVNLDGATDLGDIITKIQDASNAGSGPRVTVQIPAGDPTHLRLTDSTIGIKVFAVQAVNGSLAGAQLGILGTDINVDGVIDGTPLNPDNLIDHFFISPGGGLNASIDLSVDPFELSAALGLLQISVHDYGITDFESFLSIEVSAELTLKDPGPVADSRITLKEITDTPLDQLSNLVNPPVVTVAEFSGVFPLQVTAGGFDFGIDEGDSTTIPKITLSLNTPGDLGSGLNFDTNTAFDNLLSNLLDFDINDIINLVLGLIDFLQDSDNETLNTNLPLVGQSINDLFGFVDDLGDAVTGIFSGIAKDALAAAIEAIGNALPGGLSTTQQNRFNSALSDLNDVVDTLNTGGLTAASGFDVLRDLIAGYRILQGALGDLGSVPVALQTAVDALTGSVAVLDLAHHVDDLILTVLPASVSEADKARLFEIRDQILNSVDDVANQAGSSAQKALRLGTKLVGLVGQLRDVIESFSLGATDQTAVNEFITDNVLPDLLSLEALGARLSKALGLPTDAITVELIDADSASMVVDRALALQLHLEEDFSRTVPLEFSLGGGFGPLSIESGGQLEITFGGSLDIGFAISLSDGDIFILDSSEFNLEAEIAVDDLTAAVKIGGVGVELGTDADPGKIFLNETGLEGADPAALSISINDTPAAGDDGAIPLSSVGSSLNFTGVQGMLIATIPVYVVGVEVGTGLTATLDLSDGTVDFNVGFTPADILSGLLDLSMLIQFLPQLLTFLGDGLQSDIIGSIPIVGNELNAVGEIITDFNDGFVTPLTQQINAHKAEFEMGGAHIETVEDFIQEALFNSIGPGGNGILKLDPTTDSTGAAGMLTGDGTKTQFDPMVGPETGGTYVVTLDADGAGGADPVAQVLGTHYSVAGTVVTFLAAPVNGALIVIEFLDFQDVEFALTADEATLDLHLVDDVTESSPVFDLGLDGFLLEGSISNGGVDVTLGYDIRLGFGISKAAGFFVRLPEDDATTTEVDESHEAELSLAVSLADSTEISARLFLMELIATQDNSVGNTGFSGTLILDLVDADNVLTLEEFGAFEFAGDTGITGEAEVHLALELGVEGADETLPRGTSALEVEWDFDQNDLEGSTPVVRLNDITLNLGSFLSRALGPALDGLNDFLAPIRPILDILDTEIPLVSQLSQLFGGDEVTFLDAISLFGEGFETVEEFLEILIAIDDFVAAFDALANGDIEIGFGTLHFNNANAYDLRDPGAALSALEGDQANVLSDAFANLAAVIGQAGDEGGGLLESLVDLGVSFPIFENPLPFLRALLGSEEPIDLVQWEIPVIEAGFTLEIPPIGPILPPVPLFIVFSGGAHVEFDFSLGVDTRGIVDTGNFIDGIYFGDFENVNEGPEVPEVTLGVEIAATAELNVIVASAGVTGGIRAEVFADWHDEASPGKVYLDEILMNLQRGIECIFDLGGALTAFLEAFVKIGFDTPFGFVTLFEDSLTLAEITLLDFSLACPPLPPPILAHASDGSGSEDTVNGVVIPSGALILHLGPFAGLRQPGYSSDGDEILLVRGEADINGDGIISLTTDLNEDGHISEDELGDDLDGDGVLEADVIGLLGFEVFELHSGVTRIYGDAGAGEDSVIFSFVGNIPGTLFGGPGEDIIIGGAGADGISGGNDSLPGFGGVLSFSGGVAGSDADDQLTGNAGNDTMKGGDGADLMFGNAGGDSMHGGEGNDTVHGGSNDGTELGDLGDYIEGNGGDDNIRGHSGNDTVFAGAGNDQVRGGLGDDDLHGGSEQDLIEGGAGTDKVFGDAGDDLLFGEGADVNPGSGGNDTVFGGAGNDTIKDAEPGPNDPNGDGTGNDLFYGDGDGTTVLVALASQGPDLLVGGVGNDILFGNGGDELRPTDTGFALFGDTLEGGAGDDYLEGGAGNDTVLGGSGTDRMIGGAGGSEFGELGGTFTIGTSTHYFPGLGDGGLDGADSMVGSSGNDVMLGDNGTITGSSQDVKTVATGGSGIDTIEGGGGNDVIFGGGRGDLLIGDGVSGFFLPGDEPGNDVVVGDQGERTADRIVAMHSAEANSGGNDSISGSDGVDTLLGGDGNDNIAGDNNIDYLVGDNGKVTLASGIVLRVETLEPLFGGNDTITGGNAPDIALGGTGDDIVSGGNDASADILLGDNGVVNFNDPAHPGEINDIFSIDPMDGGEDTMSGGFGEDTVVGGSGGNDLHPNGGDVLYGNQGNDVVIGDNAYITRDDVTAVVQKIETIAPDKGGDDLIDGAQGMDTLLGGFGNDTVFGGTQDDVILGDNGLMEWLSNGRFAEIPGLSGVIQEANAALFAKYSTAVADNDVTTLDLVTTASPTLGGRDLIIGGDGKDFAFGGTDVDTIFGDDGTMADLPEGVGSVENKDLLFGDHGRIYPQFSAPGVDVNSRNFFSIHMADTDGGDGDRMWGEEGADLLLGGQGDDRMFGGSGHDDMVGGHNVAGGTDELTTPDVTATINPPINDVMDGGTGDDAMAGDNATIWRRADDVSARFRALTAATIYTTPTDDTITTNVGSTAQSDPEDSVGRDIRLLDHSDTTPVGQYGDDVMAGNVGNDTMFGELGNDLMQGDGFIGANDGNANTISREITFVDSGNNPDTDQTLFFNIPEAVTDGNDYMEGNGHNDLMYGNLGQDDMIGGSSDLYGLTSDVMRPDGSDVIFGGAGMDISRNNIGDATEDAVTHVITTTATGHARDADYIMGDNATIFRLVQGGASGTNPTDPADVFLTFAYDIYGTLKIIPRAMTQHDYTLGGADYAGGTYTGGVANADNGAADLIHGESGDDFIFGMTGSDVIFGEGQDDDIIGGYGNDWISGGTGQDGIVGDDGLVFTSRNGTAEPLYGVTATTQQTISTSGQVQYAIINVNGQLKKSVELVPFSYDPSWNATEDEFLDNADNTPFADDVMFGGLGDDFLHGGSGDDAMSGAEALNDAYVPTYGVSGNPNGTLNLGYAVVGVPTILNPGDVLAFNPNDPDNPSLTRAGEFDLFDEFDARRLIQLDGSGNLWKSSAQGAAFAFLLNFNEDEGVVRPAGQVTGGGRPLQYPAVRDDGRDILFGGNGNDWLVGGTGRDDMWGGWGNDLHNADDDHSTNGNLNNAPDTHPTYEDRAYGGAGRDVLISNTGGDRLIDWVGEFNSYFVPFSPFGEPDVSRFLLPFLPDYLYALSKADGADQSQIDDLPGETLRNGEPGGEIALVVQSDVAWSDQIGAPGDPQPGTIPGGGRDVLWSADPTIPQGGPGQGLLTAESTALDASASVTPITENEMTTIANVAIQQWSSVLQPDQRSALSTLQFALVGELPDDALAWYLGDGLTLIDANAAGRGWFVDSTPWNSSEFRNNGNELVAKPNSAADGRMDLLTAVIHEIGHSLGYEHSDNGAMEAILATGQREPLIDWKSDSRDRQAALGWNSTGGIPKPAFPEFTVEMATPKKRMFEDISAEADLTPIGEVDWYVEV